MADQTKAELVRENAALKAELCRVRAEIAARPVVRERWPLLANVDHAPRPQRPGDDWPVDWIK